jgi:hypothetical protein
MSTNFQIQFKKSKGNLHIQTKGDFDGSSAWELINLIHDQYDGKGRVFIDTRNLDEIHPFGCNTFQCRLNIEVLPTNRLCFKGKKGFEIAPNGSRIIVNSKNNPCRCNGNCKRCICSAKKNKLENTTNKKVG